MADWSYERLYYLLDECLALAWNCEPIGLTKDCSISLDFSTVSDDHYSVALADRQVWRRS